VKKPVSACFYYLVLLLFSQRYKKKTTQGTQIRFSSRQKRSLLLTGEGRGRAGRDYGILAVLFVAGQGKRAEAREESECNEEFHLDGCLL